MSAFLLWNVDQKPLDGIVQSLVREHQIDIVLLVEYAFGNSHLPQLLMRDGLFKRGSTKGFGVFARVNHRLQRLRFQSGRRVGMWSLTPPSGREGILVLVHGLDRRNYDDSTRRFFFRTIADAIRKREKARNHCRSLIAGDLNAHPFESAIVDSDGLHAIGVQSIGADLTRSVGRAGITKDFFYNPMWRMYGHGSHLDAGAATFHWMRRGAYELGWHMLDQVVIRPGECARFPEDQLQIVTQVGAISLLGTDGHPDAATASDHLPIIFHWHL